MDFSFKVVWLLLVAAMTVHGAPMSKLDAANYLKKFGHPDLKSFQQWAGLPASGNLDAATLDKMTTARCGISDAPPVAGGPSSYVLVSKWANKTLVYNVSIYTPDMTKTNVDAEIARAFAKWQSVSQLKFTKWSPGKTNNINISFVAGDHGDGYPFDGPLGVLAHAFYPSSGWTHFDEAETWTMLVTTGINLFQVALHEFGHTVGLGHTNITGNIMQPYYTGYNAAAGLGSDDIAGVQALYGAPIVG